MLQTPDIHTKALLDLADYMDGLDPKLYDQTTFHDGCGRGCIAYWATQMAGQVPIAGEIGCYMADAARRLGLDQETANRLFAPNAGEITMMGCFMRGPTPQEAASAIRHLAVTGEVPSRW